MFDSTSCEFAFQLCIDTEVLQALIIHNRSTVQCMSIGSNPGTVHTLLRRLHFSKAQVLANGEGIVKAMLEAVSHHFLIAGIGVV
ncbi:hypothetical protein D3C73_1391100 [compost metagenome]